MLPRNKLAALALALAAFAGATPAARAALRAVSAGVSMPTPMGDESRLLNRPAGLQADAWIDGLKDWQGTSFHFQATYQPYSVNNLADSRLSLFGLFAGAQVSGGVAALGIVPFLALDLGGVFNSLSLANGSSGTSNQSVRLALQAVPGVDFPVYGRLGGVVELPVTLVLRDNTLAVWNGSFSLRWKL